MTAKKSSLIVWHPGGAGCLRGDAEAAGGGPCTAGSWKPALAVDLPRPSSAVAHERTIAASKRTMPFVLLSAQVESTVNCWEPMPVVARVRCQRFNIDRDMWYRTQAGMRVSGPAVAMLCPLEGKVRLSRNSSMYVLRGLPGFNCFVRAE